MEEQTTDRRHGSAPTSSRPRRVLATISQRYLRKDSARTTARARKTRDCRATHSERSNRFPRSPRRRRPFHELSPSGETKVGLNFVVEPLGSARKDHTLFSLSLSTPASPSSSSLASRDRDRAPLFALAHARVTSVTPNNSLEQPSQLRR